MNDRDKTKDELMEELQNLRLEHDSVKASYINEIQELKLAEEALRESELIYHLLFENSGEAILLTNPDGTIYSANPEACRIFGRSEDEICKLGRNGICDFNDPRLNRAINQRKKTGKFKGVLNLLRKKGEIFPAEVSSTLFSDASGFERTAMIIHDISELKKVEEDLTESKSLLTSIIDSTVDLIWSVDPIEFRLLTFNSGLNISLKKRVF